MQVIKTIFFGLTAGVTIGGVWNLQDQNYILGTVVALAIMFTGLVVLASKVK